MGLRSWAIELLRKQDRASGARVDLVEPEAAVIDPPSRVGLNQFTPSQPWSTARMLTLFENASCQPSAESFLAARVARYRVSCFWVGAPVDLLRSLYEGPLGDLQRLELECPVVKQKLASDEERWVQRLKQMFGSPLERARQLNLVLALMPYTKPGDLRLEDPFEDLPAWLLPDYINYCQPDLRDKINQPLGLLKPASNSGDDSTLTIEPLTDRRGEAAMAWFRDEDVLSHMTDLIKMYEENPSRQETNAELNGLRSVVAQLWLDIEPIQFQTLWNTAVGGVTQALILSGFGAEILDQQDQQARQYLAKRSENLEADDAPGVILAMLLFHPKGSVTLLSTESFSSWFVDVMNDLL